MLKMLQHDNDGETEPESPERPVGRNRPACPRLAGAPDGICTDCYLRLHFLSWTATETRVN
jgi:hypothetical protein